MKFNVSVMSCVLAVCSSSAWAFQEFHLANVRLDFAAPSTFGEPSGVENPVGTIVYDTSTNQFKGLNALGDWNAFSVAGSDIVTSSGSAERIERAHISNNGVTCTITRQSGNWVTSVTRTAAGKCTLTVTGFSDRPSCNITKDEQTAPYYTLVLAGSTSTSIQTGMYELSSTSYKDADFDIICMGPR